MGEKMRLVTRSDFDGLACAMMLKELDLIDDIKFVHPKDVQDGKVELSKNDITTNLPYDPRVELAFDHHESEMDRLKALETGGKLIIDPKSLSASCSMAARMSSMSLVRYRRLCSEQSLRPKISSALRRWRI